MVGQDRAGKTSLKKSFLGLPFNPKEQSTEGIEVDPSVCKIEVDQVKNWNSTSENKPSLAEFSEDISRMVAEKHYHWIVNEAEKDSEMESDLELTEEGWRLGRAVAVNGRALLSSATREVFQDENNSV